MKISNTGVSFPNLRCERIKRTPLALTRSPGLTFPVKSCSATHEIRSGWTPPRTCSGSSCNSINCEFVNVERSCNNWNRVWRLVNPHPPSICEHSIGVINSCSFGCCMMVRCSQAVHLNVAEYILGRTPEIFVTTASMEIIKPISSERSWETVRT